MRFDLSLRGRFIGALLLVAVILAVGFGHAVGRFVEVLEQELKNRSLVRELDHLQAYLERGQPLPPTHEPEVRAYLLHPGDSTAGLPEPLQRLRAGKRREIEWQGRAYQAGRRDVGELRLYAMLDIHDVEQLERRLIALAVLFVTAGLAFAVLLGLLLSRVVTGPVSRLAQRVRALDPSQRGVRVGDRYGDREIASIADAFDRYLEDMDQFVAREQAFTEDASHELRTPLTVMSSAAELLEGSPELGPQNRERVARIRRAAAQMRSLIEALLYLSRRDGGLAEDDCELGELLQEAVEAQREASMARGIGLLCRIDTPQRLRAPRGMVLCVINNLLGNALQHTDHGLVELRLEPGRICVQDSGAGIPDAELPRIFERHYRGAQSRGSGLGLYIVKRICDQLGWRIEAGNAPGGGARFEVYFVTASA
ncbi:sensor histidine kinase [Solimonas sp. K1W22B-7]|uniref:sensor histidine kinase n=1 Tax=Solimonas sp. K1W22B-7 TaxID=2303331 RepID=UPI000E32DE24|nr:HAMP domain-containing sensor histidine kinase [Solimonas sp. K1W22B-7]AXQ30423.1 sensor histidine kinase [Solimonas sp. K1W22B-7]